MTTADQFGAADARHTRSVLIAGALWPVYKLVALGVGLLVLAVVAALTSSAGAAVLAAAGVTTAAWLGLGLAARTR